MEGQNILLQQIIDELKSLREEVRALSNQPPKDSIKEDYIQSLPALLMSKHVRKIFGVSSVTIYSWSQRNLLNPKTVNRRKYFDKAEVLSLLNSKRQLKAA